MLPDKLPLASRRGLDRIGTAVGIAGTLAALGLALCPGRVILQARRDESVPFRVGIRLNAPGRWERGQLVMFRTRDLAPYYPAGSLFTKIVAAVPRDRLRIEGRDFYVNDVFVGTARPTDSLGRPAVTYHPVPGVGGLCIDGPAAQQTGGTPECRVPPGSLFVLGTHPQSFDSRYWGLVAPPEIIGRVVPLW
jgi:type IV secretory pathway protease TraF